MKFSAHRCPICAGLWTCLADTIETSCACFPGKKARTVEELGQLIEQAAAELAANEASYALRWCGLWKTAPETEQ